MKKKIKGRKLSRGQGARRALFRALISALITEGRIVTTYAKAKAISGKVDKLTNLAKATDVSKKRQIRKIIGNKRKLIVRLSTQIAPLFSDRKGGYTKIVRLPRRRGDAAEMARIEWVTETRTSDKDKKKESKMGEIKKASPLKKLVSRKRSEAKK